jgi:hypothetical protein
MPALDAFNTDVFSSRSLSQAMNELPYVPGRLGELGLFEERSLTTTTVMVENIKGRLGLIPSKPRGGGHDNFRQEDKRTARSFVIPHFPLDDKILAEDVQNVRAFGSETELETVASVVNDRLQSLGQHHEVMHEFMRVRCLDGEIIDGDATTTLVNIFTEFGVDRTDVGFNLDDADEDIRAKCMMVRDAILDNLGGLPHSRIRGICSAEFFRALIGHTDVRDQYLRFQDSLMNRSDVRASFPYGDIFFEQYRGGIGDTNFVSANECWFYPEGVPGLFLQHFAPADFMETVNTRGLRMYAKQQLMDFERGVELHTQSNYLPLCTIPGVLVRGLETSDEDYPAA